MPELDITVVVGFRDWGADRLHRSVRSILGAGEGLGLEVIISDYGSKDPSQSRRVADSTGARWISTPGDPVWSRARALNAGFRIARGQLLISTDADMLFSPGSMVHIYEAATDAYPCAAFLQCRDLPESIHGVDLDAIAEEDWDSLDRQSRLRPRWGMGGMMAIDREGFSLMRGFDERMHTYGREDLDFALRARRAGRRTVWVDSPEAKMFHMWHPRSGDAAEATEQGREAIARNRRIVDTDLTAVRNETSSAHPVPNSGPLVSIVIIPADDSSADLDGTIATSISQSIRDSEVILVQDIAKGDPPLPILPRTVRTVSLRGSAGSMIRDSLQEARGHYVTFVQAGDLLPTDRNELLLRTINEGDAGATGHAAAASRDGESWTLHAAAPSEHAALMRRDAVLAVLNVEDGAFFTEVRTLPDLLRRAGFEISSTDSVVVLHSPGADRTRIHSPSPEQPSLLALLPGNDRRAVVHLDPGVRPDLERPTNGELKVSTLEFEGELIHGSIEVSGATYADIITLTGAGGPVTVTSAHTPAPSPERTWLDHLISHSRLRGTPPPFEIHLGSGPAESSHQYTYSSPKEATVVHVSTPGSAGHSTCARWIIAGATTEQVGP